MKPKKNFSDDANNKMKRAIKFVHDRFIQRGYSITKTKNDFFFYVYRGNSRKRGVYVETRLKDDFINRETFRYKEVNFLARKKPKNGNEEFFYVIVSNAGCMILMHSSQIYLDEYNTNKNCNSEFFKGQDEFYSIPKEKCEFISDRFPELF